MNASAHDPITATRMIALLTVCSHSAQFRASPLRANLAIPTSSTTNASIPAPILCSHSQAPIAPTILKSTVVVSSQSARSFISPASMPRPRPIPDNRAAYPHTHQECRPKQWIYGERGERSRIHRNCADRRVAGHFRAKQKNEVNNSTDQEEPRAKQNPFYDQ